MTTSRSHKRRPSDVASDLFKSIFGRFRRNDDQKRSLSTGDLAEEPETNYLEMDFSAKPTTSGVDPSFDDCDRVPMDFSSNRGGRLLPQNRASSRRIMHSGSTESLNNFAKADLHNSQPWFFQNIDSYKAERIIKEAGCNNGTFLVHYLNGIYQLVCAHNGQICHRRITKQVKHGDSCWRIGLEKPFENLVELVAHYRNHKGFVLPTKLKNGVARPLRPSAVSQRTRA